MTDPYQPIAEPGTATAPDASGVGEAADRLARRPWPAIPIRSDLEISFEFFPPSTPAAADRLDECADQLAAFDPSFVSVTYGAGGSTRDRTFDAIERLGARTGLEVAGHLTAVAADRSETLGAVDRYRDLGVRRIVALRGDPPTDGGEVPKAASDDGFVTAADLVAGIRAHVGDEVDIAVAAYPETHPKADSPAADLDNLKAKVDAGADRAITQFFFDNTDFLRFRDRCQRAGITVPLVAGIMPIVSFERIVTFAGRCGAKIPAWMHDLLGGVDDEAIHQLVAATVAAEQCRELAEHGVRHFHFYTMNRPELTAATCRILGVRPGAASAAPGANRFTA